MLRAQALATILFRALGIARGGGSRELRAVPIARVVFFFTGIPCGDCRRWRQTLRRPCGLWLGLCYTASYVGRIPPLKKRAVSCRRHGCGCLNRGVLYIFVRVSSSMKKKSARLPPHCERFFFLPYAVALYDQPYFFPPTRQIVLTVSILALYNSLVVVAPADAQPLLRATRAEPSSPGKCMGRGGGGGYTRSTVGTTHLRDMSDNWPSKTKYFWFVKTRSKP